MRAARLLFRLLLLTWPSGVRRTHGLELEEMFVRCLEMAQHRKGSKGLLAAYVRGIADVLLSSIAAHREEHVRRRLEGMSQTCGGTGGAMRVFVDALTGIGRDARFALRVLARERSFTATVLLTLIICIGGNATMFSIVRSVLLKPLPIADPDRVVLLANIYPKAGFATVAPDVVATSAPDYVDRLRETRSFQEQALYVRRTMTLGLPDGAESVQSVRATPSFFTLVGARPLLGRLFAAEDGEVGKNRTVVLSYGFWQRRYAKGPSALGQDLRLNGVLHQIVGVMPHDFEYLWSDIDVWLPVALTDEQRSDRARHSNNWVMIARLKPGTQIETARAEIDALNARNDLRLPHLADLVRSGGFRTVIVPLHDAVVRNVRSTLLLLWGGAIVVLLVGVVNLANLFLSRAARRARELATRAAIGASAMRIGRQIVTETTVLALGGGAAGIAAGWGLLRSLGALHIDVLPRGHVIGLDWQSAVVMLSTAGVVGILMGALPSAGIWRINLVDVLREAGRAGTSGLTGRRLRAALATAQVSLAFVLLFGAALLVASFRAIVGTDAGFRMSGILTASLNLPVSTYPDNPKLVETMNRMLASIRALPGVDRAALTNTIPFGSIYSQAMVIAEDVEPRPGDSFAAPLQVLVSDGYFETMSIQLSRGRYFDQRDTPGSMPAVIVDEHLAQKFWPGRDPLGRRVYLPQTSVLDVLARGPNTRYWTVVGVVKETKTTGLAPAGPPLGAYYFPYSQAPARSIVLAVRASGEPDRQAENVRKAVASIDRELPLFDVQTLEERLDRSLLPRRTPMLLALAFGLVALFLAAIGVYGVLAYQVGERRREIGVRIALGSTARDILRLVLRDGARITIAGMLLGVAGSLALERVADRLLFGVRAADPLLMAIVAGILGTAALAATVIPARRAAAINPIEALNG